MSRLSFLIRSSSSTILFLIPLAFHCRILRQPLLLTSAFLDGAAWCRSLLSTPLLFALVEQFSQWQEPVDMCMLCSPLDILEQFLWQVRRHPTQTSGWGEYLTTCSHCRHRFLGALVPESLGAPIGCPTSVGTVDGRGGVQERDGSSRCRSSFLESVTLVSGLYISLACARSQCTSYIWGAADWFSASFRRACSMVQGQVRFNISSSNR